MKFTTQKFNHFVWALDIHVTVNLAFISIWLFHRYYSISLWDRTELEIDGYDEEGHYYK